MLSALEATAGAIVLILVFYDLFQSVLLPRPAVAKLRLSILILRPLWGTWKFLGGRVARNDRREDWLGAFGPLGEGFVRISYAASLEQIATGLERMGRYLRGVAR